MSEKIRLGIVLKADGSGLVGELRLSKKELDNLGKSAKGAGKDAERGARGVDKFGKESRQTASEARRLNKENKNLSQGFNNVQHRATLLRAAILALATGMSVRLVNSFIDAASTSERYATTLKVVLGDVAEANRLFDDMANFASRVPFEFEKIMGAATDLAGVVRGGRKEIGQLIPIIADIAAATGISIDVVTSQIIRMYSAGAAAADTFRDRGITATLGFQTGVSYSARETMAHLFKIWDAGTVKYKGATDALANTWTGTMSMLSDKWFIFRNQVMDAAPFDYLKATFNLINDEFGRNTDEMKVKASALGQDVVAMVKEIVLGTADIIDTISPVVSTIGRGIGGIWDGYRQLPEEVRTWGLIGAVFLGKKGLVGLAAISAASSYIDQWNAFSQKKMVEFGVPKGVRDFINSPTNYAGITEKVSPVAKPGSIDFTAASESLRVRAQTAISEIEKRASAARAERKRALTVSAVGGNSPVVPGNITPSVKATDDATEATKKYLQTTQNIRAEFDRLPRSYAAANQAALKWREDSLAGLDMTKQGYDEFAAMVDQVYFDKLDQAYNDNLDNSRRWQDGLIRGLRNVGDSAGDMASQFEGAVGRMSKQGEDAFVGLAKGTMTLTEAWRSMADSIIEDMLRMQYQSMIAGPVSGFLSGALSDIFSFGGGNSADASLAPQYQNTAVGHTGGIVGQLTDHRRVDPGIFAGAARFHSGGLVAGEVPIIAKAGEEVLTRSDPRHRLNSGRGGSAPVINIIDQRGASTPDVQVNQSFSPDNEALIEIIIPAVETAADRGMLDEALARNFANHRNPAVGS